MSTVITSLKKAEEERIGRFSSSSGASSSNDRMAIPPAHSGNRIVVFLAAISILSILAVMLLIRSKQMDGGAGMMPRKIAGLEATVKKQANAISRLEKEVAAQGRLIKKLTPTKNRSVTAKK